MPGEGQEIDAVSLHVYRISPTGLCGVDQKDQAVVASNASHLGDREQRADHVGGVVERDHDRVGLHGCFHIRRVEKALWRALHHG